MSKGNPKSIEYYINDRGCHICTSHYLRRGYPLKCVKVDGKWRKITVVKYLWEQVNGIISNGLVLRHNCDETKCINLEHVVSGTQVDNIQDAVDRNRFPKGVSRMGVKLNEVDVIFIRENAFPHGQRLSQVTLAKMFGIAKVSVHSIIHRKIWKHI